MSTAPICRMVDKNAARALGITGIGIGLAELAAPGWLSRQLGLSDGKRVLRAFGIRELLSGVAILAREDAAPGLWSRVAGDAMDVAALGIAARRSSRKKILIGAIAAVAAITALDAIFATRATR